MIKYFISYNYSKGNSFRIGNFENHRNEEIKDIYDIQELSRSIEKDNGYPDGSIVIMNFIKLP